MNSKKLIDITDIVIDKALEKEERLKSFVKQIGDPYHFMVDDVEVLISFEEDGERLQEKMERYFQTMII